jgi:uncharacterized protein YbjT (DUF2867 family)
VVVRCLVVGATGYVGARLVPRLLAAGHSVRVLARDERKVAARAWAGEVEVRLGDVADATVTGPACQDVDAVFYLVHSMDAAAFADRDRAAAEVLAEAAGAAGVGRIVYLGGLQPSSDTNSTHLASRHEVGDVLLRSGVPTAVVQAGVVVGTGSASFEMLRHLAASSPILPMPDDAWNEVQPIAVDDVLFHLVACLDLPPEVNEAFDVGGTDVLTYREMLVRYATAAGLLRPLSVPLPIRAPRMAARAVQAITPVDRFLAGPLLESMAYDLVAHGTPPTGTPPGGALGYDEAVRRAIDGAGAAGEVAGDPSGPILVSEDVVDVDAPVAELWEVISGVGGDNGWYTIPGVWALRGKIDELVGGVGDRRTRPATLRAGEAIDSWRIESVEDGRVLRLRSETKLPGVARMEMRAIPHGSASRYVQRVTFEPLGLAGRVYWYGQLPAHNLVFGVMAKTIAGVAAKGLSRQAPPRSVRRTG